MIWKTLCRIGFHRWRTYMDTGKINYAVCRRSGCHVRRAYKYRPGIEAIDWDWVRGSDDGKNTESA